MNAVAKPRNDLQGQGQRTWTDAQRAEQSAKLRARQIWLKSTGPCTPQGKINSSKNARHADFVKRRADRAEYIQIRTYLRTQKSYTDLIKLFIKQEHSLNKLQHDTLHAQLFFLENELIDIERKMFGGLRFHEICGLDNRQNVISFPERPPHDS